MNQENLQFSCLCMFSFCFFNLLLLSLFLEVLSGKFLKLLERLHNLKVFFFNGKLEESFRIYQIYTTIMRIDLESALTLVLIKIFILDMSELQNQITTVLTSVECIFTIVLAPISIYFGVRRELKIIQIPYIICTSCFSFKLF
jgi:hypothetical protein